MNLKDLKKQYNSISPDSDLNVKARANLMEKFKDACPNSHTSWVDDAIRVMAKSVRPAFVGVSTVLVIGILTLGLYVSSANAMPGDFLYPVKISFEKARMQIAFKESSQNALRAEVLHERLTEAELLAKRLNENGTSYNTEFNTLAKNFVNELDALKQDIKEDMNKNEIAEQEKQDQKESQTMVTETDQKESKESNKLFPDEKLLSNQENTPVEDGREIHPFNNNNLKEFQSIVEKIKENLKDENMKAALNQIEKAKDLVSEEKDTNKQESKENDINKDSKENQEENIEENEGSQEENIEKDSNTEETKQESETQDTNIQETNNIKEETQDEEEKEDTTNNTNTKDQTDNVINDSFNTQPASLGNLNDNSGKVDVQEDNDFNIGNPEINSETSIKTGMSLDSETE